jgi:hypothetical protein
MGDRDRLFDRFFAGYRRGLADPDDRPPQPDIVRWLRARNPPLTHQAFLDWAETKMAAISDEQMRALIASMEVFATLVQDERRDLPVGFFQVSRAGLLQMGIGSASTDKVLMRVRGDSIDPADDVVLEAKAVRALSDLGCLEVPQSRPTFRVIAGSQQLGRLKHEILAAGPEVPIPEMTIRGTHVRFWWLRSWESSYREVSLKDLRSVDDLAAIVYDSGVQLGAGHLHRPAAANRTQSLTSIAALEARLRKEAENLVQELLRGWEDLKVRFE